MKLEEPKRILYVEDDDTIREAIASELKDCARDIFDRCEVDTAPGPIEAKVMMASKKYDIIFVDYHLPVMNGCDFIASLEVGPIIVIITGDVSLVRNSCRCGKVSRVIDKMDAFNIKLIRQVFDDIKVAKINP